jgi:hypothetical protein
MKRCAVCGKFQKKTTEMILHDNKTICPVCAAKLNIQAKLIEAGRNGVTKHQMIPAIMKHYDNVSALNELKAKYPETFVGSLRYIKKSIREQVINATNSSEESLYTEEYKALVKAMNPSRKGITYHQIINTIKDAYTSNNKSIIKLIKKYFPEKLANSIRYLDKKHQAFISEA